jgi:hypothetical protein
MQETRMAGHKIADAMREAEHARLAKEARAGQASLFARAVALLRRPRATDPPPVPAVDRPRPQIQVNVVQDRLN